MIWGWWKDNRKKYPSSLYVTVQGMNPPKVGNDKVPSGGGAGVDASSSAAAAAISKANLAAAKTPKIPVWSRLPGQNCKIPNCQEHGFEETRFGQVTSIKFSGDGRSLGVADGCKVIVFNVPSFEPSFVLRGHTATVHDIDFGDNGGSQVVLASASGDQTARVWSVEKVSLKKY